MKVLLGVTGSVAATLVDKLVNALHEAGHEVKIVATNQSQYFFTKKSTGVQVFTEASEWPKCQYEKGDEVTHIALRDWADVLLIAPLSANTLAKMVNGICDNLLTCVYRAWHRDRPLIIAPAMNTVMWTHPITAEHLERLQRWNKLTVVNPISKKLACGDEGVGALAPIGQIIQTIK